MKKIVIFGGGSGLSQLLKGLKLFPLDITAVVSVSDNGKSTGRLRKEMNIPAVGDITKVMLSMANIDTDVENLLNYRFTKSKTLGNHSIKNLLLTALLDLKGDFASSLPILEKILDITNGKILPLTEDSVNLVGITESGTVYSGNVKSSVGLGIILHEGIGDTIRVSLTGDPVEEVKSAKLILRTLGLRKGGVEVVSCPTCGRTQIDLIHLANQVEDMVSGMDLDVKVAVMGCVVNGPGEARSADIGIAGGIGEGLLIKKGEIIKKVPENELLSVLREELLKMQEMQK